MSNNLMTPLFIEVNNHMIIFKNELNEVKLQKLFDMEQFEDLKAFLIADNRSEKFVILYNSDQIIAKQCKQCKGLLKLLQFSKNSAGGYGQRRAVCKGCLSKQNARTLSKKLMVYRDYNRIRVEGEGINQFIDLEANLESTKELTAKHVVVKNKNVDVVIVYSGNEILMKTCNECGSLKFLKEFHKRKRGYGNTKSECRDCINITDKRRNVEIRVVTEGNKKFRAKRCSKCNELRPLTEYRDGNGPGNKTSICSLCERNWHENYRQKNKRAIKEKQKAAYYNNREQFIQKSQDYYKKKPHKTRMRMRQYYQKKRDDIIERNKRWAKNNIDKVSQYRINYKAKKKALINALTYEEVADIKDTYLNKCSLSGDSDIQFDHFISINTGHAGTYKGNIILLSSSLNASKGDKNPFEWIKDYNHYYYEFETLVNNLAIENGLTYNQFKQFVYWCYNNRRTIEQIREDNRPSIEIWRSINDVKGD